MVRGNAYGSVLVFGTFDLLHLGHIAFLRQAKRYGSRLIVALSSNHAVKKIKGSAPFFTQKERGALVKELALVDRVLVGQDAEFKKAIRLVRPQVICLGYDQEAYVGELHKFLAKEKLLLRVVRLRSVRPWRYKTTRIKAL